MLRLRGLRNLLLGLRRTLRVLRWLLLLRLLLPAVARAVVIEEGRAGAQVRTIAVVTLSWDLLHRRSHGRRHSYSVRVATFAAFDPIARRQEGIKALDQVRVASEEVRHTINNARRIDSAARVSTPKTLSHLPVTGAAQLTFGS